MKEFDNEHVARTSSRSFLCMKTDWPLSSLLKPEKQAEFGIWHQDF